MASAPNQALEDHSPTETDEETIALRKKRSRRVSFAENTSVHFFKRDDSTSSSSPTSSTKNHTSTSVSDVSQKELLGFYKDLADADDSKFFSPSVDDNVDVDVDDDDEKAVEARKSFLRRIDSLSPGSSNVGSATSNDDENYFGPVSASFIRPGRLSDSAASDDNHDVTMDSTAFSMHFRSLVQSDFGDLKTPSTVHASEEKTPSVISAPSKKLGFKNPLSAGAVSGGKDSNEMSLVGGEPRSYDYGKLSPQLRALLEEGDKALHETHVSNFKDPESMKQNEDFTSEQNGGSDILESNCGSKEIGNSKMLDRLSQRVHKPGAELDDADGVAKSNNVDKIECNFSPKKADDLAAVTYVDHELQTPKQTCKEPANQSKVSRSGGTLSIGFPAVTNRTGLSLDNNVVSLCSLGQLESPIELRNGWFLDQQLRSPLAASSFLLSVKDQQLQSSTNNSDNHKIYLTPQPRLLDFHSSKRGKRSSEVISSFQKINSKLKTFEPFPRDSSLKDNIENSKLRLEKLLSSASSPSNSAVQVNPKCSEGNLDIPITTLEQHFNSVDMKSVHDNRMSHTTDGTRTPNGYYNSNNKRITSLAEHGQSLLTTQIASGHMPPQQSDMASPLPPSPLSKVVQQVLVASDPIEACLVGIDLDHSIDKQNNRIPDELVSPQLKRLNKNLQSLAEYQGIQSGDYEHVYYVEGVGIVSNVDKKSLTNTMTDLESSTLGNKSDSLFTEKRKATSCEELSLRESPSQEVLQKEEPHALDNSSAQHGDDQGAAYNLRSKNHSEAVLPREELLALGNSNAQCGNGQGAAYNLRSKSPRKEVLQREEPQTSGDFSAQCASEHGLANNLQCKSPSKKVLQREEPHVLGCSSAQCGNEQGSAYNLRSKVRKKNINGSSGQKRKIEEVFLGADLAPKVTRTNMSMEVSHQGGSAFMSKPATWIDHKKVLVKFLAEIKQLLTVTVDKLNYKEIEMHEGIFGQLQRMNQYQFLASQIQSQGMQDQSRMFKLKRITEIRSLLYKLVSEQVSQHLMSAKHEKLLKTAQQLNSTVQDVRKLKLNHAQQLFMPAKSVDDPLISSLENSYSKDEVLCEKLIGMRQEYEDLDSKIKNMTENLSSFCKLKGKSSFPETVGILNDHLQKRNVCGFIHEDLQSWKVAAFQSRDGQYDMLLNYQDFIHQRFLINSLPKHHISVTTKLNDMYIEKRFPNMDACFAFAHVLNSETNKRTFGSQSLAQQTQMTSSLLQNMVDIMEEIQVARLEIRNLIQATFLSPSAEQLDLQLRFVDFKNLDRKLIVTLDVTCLTRGIYPLEILPYQVKAYVGGMEKLSIVALSAEMKAQVDSLQGGYSRILQLCRCISKVLLFVNENDP